MPLAALYAGIPDCYDAEVFHHLVQQEIRRGLRYAEFFSFLLLSVDPSSGPGSATNEAIDEKLLSAIFKNVRQELRETDFIGRYGSQLALMLLHCNTDGTRRAAERVRERIARFLFPPELAAGRSRMTVSLGGACFPSDGRDLSSVVQRAFLSLRRAREASGNRTVMFHEMMGAGN